MWRRVSWFALFLGGCQPAPTGVFLELAGEAQIDAIDLTARYDGRKEARHLSAAATALPTTVFAEFPSGATQVRLDVDAWFEGEVVAHGSLDVALRRGQTTAARAQLGPTHWSSLTLGAGRLGGSGDSDGRGVAARFDGPFGLAADEQGNIYVSDSRAHTIRRIDASGDLVTFAGRSDACGSADGSLGDARFCAPRGLVVVGSALYVADMGNDTIRRIALDTGVVSTFAGAAGVAGTVDGAAATARFSRPDGLAQAGSGVLYVSDSDQHTIRSVGLDGTVTTIAGRAGEAGSADGPGTSARFNQPAGLVVRDAVLYVADRGNHVVRRIGLAATGASVTTLAGAATESGTADGALGVARFREPTGLALLPGGDLVVSDAAAHTLRRVVMAPAAAAAVTTLAGSPDADDSANGVGMAARFRQPAGLLTTPDGLLVADCGNDALRHWSAVDGNVITLFGVPPNPGDNDGDAAKAKFDAPLGVAESGADSLYVADSANATIRFVDLANRWVGTPIGAAKNLGADDGPVGEARFSRPVAVVADEDAGEPVLWVVDAGNHNVRRVGLRSSVVTTVAGAPAPGFRDGTGADAAFAQPWDLASDGAGSLYVADRGNDAIRRITVATGEVTTVAAARDGGPLDQPAGVAFAAPGLLYVANAGAHTIVRVDLGSGEVRRFAGGEHVAGFADGPADSALFSSPARIVVGFAGVALFVSDSGNHVVRRVAVDSGDVSTVVGMGGRKQVRLGPVPGELNAPVGLALLRSGGLAITTAENAIVIAR